MKSCAKKAPWLLSLLCLTALVACFIVPAPCFADAAKIYLNAKEALARKDFAAGVKNYYRLVTFSEIVLTRIIKLQDLEAAREFFENAARSGDRIEQAKLFLALIDRITDNIARAHEQIDLLGQQHPNSLLLAYVKGELHLSQNEVVEADSYFNLILSAAGQSSFAVLTRSLLKFYVGAVGIDPEERRQFLLAAANRNWDLLEIDQAIRFFEIVAHDFPHEQEAFRSLVMIYLDLEDLVKAREVHARWKAANDDLLLVPMTQARFHCACEEYAEAAAILRKLLDAEAENAQMKLMLADCLFNLDDYEGAESLYHELLAVIPRDAGIVHRLKSCLEALGKNDEAIALFESLAAGESGNAWFQLELAELYMKAGNYDQAEVFFDLLSSAENPYTDYAAEMSAQIARYRHEKAIEELAAAERLAAAQREQSLRQAPAVSGSAKPASEKMKEVQVEELKKLMAIYE